MERTKHTPGPWKVVGPEIVGTLYIARIYNWDAPNISPQHEANARLIAAAPELLRELMNARDRIYQQAHHAAETIAMAPPARCEAWALVQCRNIDAAIAKATGQQ